MKTRTSFVACVAALTLPALAQHDFYPFPFGPTLETPLELALGDLDGDGVLDVSARTAAADDELAVLPGVPGGGFRKAIAFGAGFGCNRMTIGDADGDGRSDVIADGFAGTSATIQVRSWSQQGMVVVGETPLAFAPGELVAADFDGDARLDLAVMKGGVLATALELFQGVGDGTFVDVATCGFGAPFQGLRAVDLDADGFQDLVGLRGAALGSRELCAVLGIGGTSFSAPIVRAIPDAAVGFALGDVDGDGAVDAAATSLPLGGGQQPAFLHVFHGLGNGQFSAPQSLSTAHAGLVELVDLDRDQQLDIVLVGKAGIEVRRGVGDGTFLGVELVGGSQGAKLVAVGDAEPDGWPDLFATLGTGVGQLLRAGLPPAPAPSFLATSPSSPIGMQVADATGDGRLDVVWTSNGVRVAAGLGDGTLAPPQSFDLLAGAGRVAVGDLDGDLQPDLALATAPSSPPHLLAVSLADGSGGFAAPRHILGVATPPLKLELADFDGDGDRDVLLGGATRVLSFRNRGNGSLRADAAPVLDAELCDFVLADFDHDGRVDVAAVDLHGHLSLVAGLPGGFFAPPTVMTLPGELERVAALDFDGDGHHDLALGSFQPSGLFTLRGAGDGSFVPAVFSSRSAPPRELAVVRADANALDDLALSASESGAGGVAILLGHASGVFVRESSYTTHPAWLGVGDFDGDGLDDLVGGGSAGITISLHR